MSIDLVVLLVIASGTAGAVWRFRRHGARGRHLLAATWLAFYGLALTAMMSAHSLEIASHVMAGGSRVAGERWSYDFHTYALQLLGAVLIWQGVRSLRAADAMSGGDPSARRPALHAALITMAVAAPLIPIQMFFGTLLCTVSVLTLVVLAFGPRRP